MSYCTVLSMYAFRASFVVLCEVFMVGGQWIQRVLIKPY